MRPLHKTLKHIMAFYLPPGGSVDQAVVDIEKAVLDAEYRPGTDWLDKTLRAVAGHVTNGLHDYIRSNKDFRARTVTVGELEMLLQKVTGEK